MKDMKSVLLFVYVSLSPMAPLLKTKIPMCGSSAKLKQIIFGKIAFTFIDCCKGISMLLVQTV